MQELTMYTSAYFLKKVPEVISQPIKKVIQMTIHAPRGLILKGQAVHPEGYTGSDCK